MVGGIRTLAPHIFYPYRWDEEDPKWYPYSYAVHHWNHDWWKEVGWDEEEWSSFLHTTLPIVTVVLVVVSLILFCLLFTFHKEADSNPSQTHCVYEQIV